MIELCGTRGEAAPAREPETPPERRPAAEAPPPPAKTETPEPAGETPPAPPEPPPAEETVPPAPAPAAEKSGEGSVSWPQVLAAMEGRLPPGTYYQLTDATQASGAVTERELVLRLNPFLTAMVNTPENIDRFRQTVSSLTGRPMEVRLEPLGGGSGSKLDDLLGRFSNIIIR